MDCSPPGSSVHGISQARILLWVVISFSRASFRPRDWSGVSCLARWFFTTEPPGNPSNYLLAFKYGPNSLQWYSQSVPHFLSSVTSSPDLSLTYDVATLLYLCSLHLSHISNSMSLPTQFPLPVTLSSLALVKFLLLLLLLLLSHFSRVWLCATP